MAFRTLFVACTVFSVALAQSTELQIEAIEAHFKNAELVPVPIPVFEPTAILTANFSGLSITPGQNVSEDRQHLQSLFSIFLRLNSTTEVANAPDLTLTPLNSTVTFNGNYTVAMIDPGAVGSDQSSGQNRHWLVNGAKVTSKRSFRVHVAERQVTPSCQMARSPLMVPPRLLNTRVPLPLPVLGHTG